VDVPAKLEQLEELVRGARAMPMSASCVLNRVELLDHLAELRSLLPDELAGAQRVLADSEAVVDEGRAEAERIVAEAVAERDRLIASSEVAREAVTEADRIVAAARADADAMQSQIDDYVDAKLANFEVVLHKTLAAVERGRAKISGRRDEFGEPAGDEDLLD
jgi:vacuolar-type H+-ATPase subunit H